MKNKIIRDIKKKLHEARREYIEYIKQHYGLKERYYPLFQAMEEFLSRPSKLIRPVVLSLSYKTYADDNSTDDIFPSALGFELLHNCAVIHDDIIDKSDKRRGGRAMHKILDNTELKDADIGGEEFAIIAGDILYSLGIKLFMGKKADSVNKNKALDKVLDTAVKTGLGQFSEMLLDIKDIKDIKKNDILRIYDYKSSYYTISGPLQTGAILAGTSQKLLDALGCFGYYIGRAFQIKDDIIDLSENGKFRDRFDDIKKQKKNLLMFYAYQKASPGTREFIRKFLSKKKLSQSDYKSMYQILIETGSIDMASSDVRECVKEAEKFTQKLTVDKAEADALVDYCLGLVEL